MRRTSAIAWQVLQMNPRASILTISDSPLGQFFPISANHDYIKLPSIVKMGPGNWKASHLSMPYEKVMEMRQDLLRNALTSFAPHLLLVDHMPHGAMGELIPALDALKELTPPTQVVLGLRDILDDPEVIMHRWSVEGAYEAIERYYSRVLIYGMRNMYDLVSQYHFPDSVADKIRYCGYVCTQDEPVSAVKIRTRFLSGVPKGTRFIVALAGGGADAYPVMSTLLDAVALLKKDNPCVVAMITGPFMPAPLIADLNRRAKQLPVRVMESVTDSLSYISAADLIVSMAGYNTCMEILRTKKPAILVPRSGPSAEQRTRASLFSARGWAEMLDPDRLTPENLRQKITAQWQRPVHILPPMRPDLQGVTAAANHILSLITNMERVAEPVKLSP